MNGSFKDLKVYQKAMSWQWGYSASPRPFLRKIRYASMDQVRRSSRSVCANILGADRKRRYLEHFTSKITDADGGDSETLVWIDFARDAGYIADDIHDSRVKGYEKVEKMLGGIADHPDRFLPKEIQISDDSSQYGFDDD